MHSSQCPRSLYGGTESGRWHGGVLVAAASKLLRPGCAMADAALVAAITDMGFSEPAAQRGLAQTGGDLERALEWIMM